MSNVISFQSALAALTARKVERAMHESVSGFAAADATVAAAAPKIAVSDVQRHLTRLGFIVRIDGKIGPETNAAVIAFKTSVGLNADPNVDATTFHWLQNASPGDVSEGAAAYMRTKQQAQVAATQQQQMQTQAQAAVGLTTMQKVHNWLLPPNVPFYKKPAVLIGGGLAVIAVIAALSKRK